MSAAKEAPLTMASSTTTPTRYFIVYLRFHRIVAHSIVNQRVVGRVWRFLVFTKPCNTRRYGERQTNHEECNCVRRKHVWPGGPNGYAHKNTCPLKTTKLAPREGRWFEDVHVYSINLSAGVAVIHKAAPEGAALCCRAGWLTLPCLL